MWQFPVVFMEVQTGVDIRFFPDGLRFEWGDKLGVYRFFKDGETGYLELVFNYAREETYLFSVLQTEAGMVTAFRLKDRWGKEFGFRKT